MIVAAEEWVNKHPEEEVITLFTEDHRGTEIVLQLGIWRSFFRDGLTKSAGSFLPMAELSNDEDSMTSPTRTLPRRMRTLRQRG